MVRRQKRWGAIRPPPGAEEGRGAMCARRRHASEQPPEGRLLASRSGRGRQMTKAFQAEEDAGYRNRRFVCIFRPNATALVIIL